MYFASSESRSERQPAYSGDEKILARSRGLASSCQRVHAHHGRRGRRDERRVRGRRNLRHLAQQLDVARGVVEIVVADQAAVGLAAQLAVLLFVELLEQRALVPGRALVLLEGLGEILLRDVHHSNLEHLVRFGVADEVMQPAPRAFHLLESLVMHDLVDLVGQLLVDLGDDRLDRADHVVGHDGRLAQRLLGERAHGVLDLGPRPVGLGLEFPLQQRRELVAFLDGRLCGLLLLCFSHLWTPRSG